MDRYVWHILSCYDRMVFLKVFKTSLSSVILSVQCESVNDLRARISQPVSWWHPVVRAQLNKSYETAQTSVLGHRCQTWPHKMSHIKSLYSSTRQCLSALWSLDTAKIAVVFSGLKRKIKMHTFAEVSEIFTCFLFIYVCVYRCRLCQGHV